MANYANPMKHNHEPLTRAIKLMAFGAAATALTMTTLGLIANGILPPPVIQDLISGGKILAVISVPGFAACCLKQTVETAGNGHGPLRRFANTVFNSASYKNGYRPK